MICSKDPLVTSKQCILIVNTNKIKGVFEYN